jgi:hypothetical protein
MRDPHPRNLSRDREGLVTPRPGSHILPAIALASRQAGCSRLDMQDQPKYKPQRPSDFFADGRSERQPVEGTIARGALNEDTAFTKARTPREKTSKAVPDRGG